MTINKSTLTIEQFEGIEAKLHEMKSAIDPLFDLAWSNGAFRLGRDLVDIQQSIGGLAYMVHPQEEWLGGDSSNPQNFTKRFPHIAALD